MNLCVVLPKWRPRGRGDRGGTLSARCAPSRVLARGYALRALPLRGPDNSGTQHPFHPFNVGVPSVSFPPAGPLKSEGCEAASARSARPCVDAMLGLPVPSDNAASRLAQEKMKSKLNGGIALIPGQGNQSQTYIRR